MVKTLSLKITKIFYIICVKISYKILLNYYFIYEQYFVLIVSKINKIGISVKHEIQNVAVGWIKASLINKILTLIIFRNILILKN